MCYRTGMARISLSRSALASTCLIALLGTTGVAIGQTGAPDGASAAATAKSPRLKYRDPNGTCTCTCASGGLTEKDIAQAEERRRARKTEP